MLLIFTLSPSEVPLQGAKMTVMDILEIRDMKGPAPMLKS